jgi:hypothetical protein
MNAIRQNELPVFSGGIHRPRQNPFDSFGSCAFNHLRQPLQALHRANL